MNTRRAALAALCACLVASAFACGGSTSSVGSGDGGGASSGSSGGTSSGAGPGSSACPSVAPNAKTSCSAAGLQCEYGSDPDLSCDDLATCSGGSWQSAGGTAVQTCPTPAATGSCPATYAAAEGAGSCSTSGTACGYPQGRCDCAVATGGPPTVGTKPTHWLCDDPGTASCPTPRPRVGATCTQSGLTCNYGACSIPDGVGLACTGGLWQVSPVACAL
jgi:hypothetical protein